mmetsp:Transcript_92635/g.258928  ORF Transcript_92635/g.258928 Transcript_92635/m.258928 type:complete len:99 (+) Transcript_92635:134-430(+)
MEHLDYDAFECEGGAIVGVRLPGQGGAEGSEHRVKRQALPLLAPWVFVDVAEEALQFLVFPPMNRGDPDWRLISRRAALGTTQRDVRVFVLGPGPPCE